jgi:hypothetical protein
VGEEDEHTELLIMTNNLDVYAHGQPNLTVTNMAQLALRMVSGDYKTYPFTLYQRSGSEQYHVFDTTLLQWWINCFTSIGGATLQVQLKCFKKIWLNNFS